MCGEIRGVTALVSNGIPDGSAILLDAAQIAAAATEIDVQVASSATLEMADDPDTQFDHTDWRITGLDVRNEFACDARDPGDNRRDQVERLALVLVEGIDWGGGA